MEMGKIALGTAFFLVISMVGCNLDGPVKTNGSGNTGIYYHELVIGDQESYIGFRYGEGKNRDSLKTFTGDSMTLKVVGIEGNTVTILQNWFYAKNPTSNIGMLKLDRASGQIKVLGVNTWSELENFNMFSKGIFSEDLDRKIEFSGYEPQVDMPTVGFVPEYQIGQKTYRNVTVMVDPTGVLIDVGGKCLVISSDHRLLEILNYHVFGTDGGWELQQ